jgi:N-acyl amino acid synthase of PEP-CTERM/exosortase system
MLDRSFADSKATAAIGEQLLRRLDTYFRLQEASSPKLLASALSLRYQVYCLERKFEEPDQFADRLETDEYDRRSIHGLIFYRLSDEAIGTTRLILPELGGTGLPIQSLLRKLDLDAANYFPTGTTAEVSRFAISRDFRRRNSDRAPLSGENETPSSRESECRSNLPCLGLAQILVRMSLARGITHWAALMEPKLLRMLAAMGIHFTSIGPRIFHHGIRQPSLCHVPAMLEQLYYEKPDYWAIVTDGGNLSYLPREVHQSKRARGDESFEAFQGRHHPP